VSPRPRLESSRRKRLLLSALSFLFTFLLLEGVVRLLGLPRAPVLLREGIYVSQLPMVTGRDTVPSVTGSPLPASKRPGELRVFVFGESSVEGGPWAYGASPPSMLHDHLRAILPQRDFTVVNMGRGASTMMDAYYFLVSIEAYAPDYIIFYQGSNDLFHTDRERCAPALHPRAHGAWRWLVERSRLLWAARALGPRAYTKLRPQTSGRTGSSPGHAFGQDQQPGDLCDVTTGFPAWTDLLVSTAKAMGARVIVTTPVENPLRWPDDNARSLSVQSEPYQRLLSCALTDDCDIVATWRAVRDTPTFTWDRLAPRRRAWRDTARERGARFVDFAGSMERDAEGGLRPPIFAEEVHLSLEGNWRLSWLWATELRSLVEGSPSPGLAAPPPAVDERHYLSETARYSHQGTGACILLRCADRYVRLNMRVLAGELLREAVRVDAPAPGAAAPSRAGATAQLLLGKLRRDAGLDPGLPPALAARLSGLDLAGITRELQRYGDCSTLADPAAPAR
jgi:hypothetical protein